MAKCKYWGDDVKCRTIGYILCYKSDSNCDIKPKPKPKYKKIKAWASVDDKYVVADNIHRAGRDYPCTILINSKYLKAKP